MRIRIVVLSSLVGATAVLGAVPASASTWKSCGEVSFSGGAVADSHYGATNIRTQNVGCATARSVARAVQNAHDHQYVSHGFACAGYAAGGGYSKYSCTKRDSKGVKHKVRFTTVGVG